MSGKKFAELRNASFLTQEELARQLDMTKSNIARIEGSDQTAIRQSFFRRLAEVAKLTPDELLARIGANGVPPIAGVISGADMAKQQKAAASSSAKVQKKDEERKKRRGKE